MKYLIANFKSHKSREEMEKWLTDFEQQVFHSPVKIILCPPMPSLMFISNRLLDRSKHPVTFLGVQDISSFPAGAYTGAVSAWNLAGFMVNYALVGHSERRRYFHETHQEVANKVAQCLENSITPIVCVDADYIQAQANAINPEYLAKCVVAYEPLAAIGSGFNQPIEEVEVAVAKIKQAFGQIPVIYGGSVNANNAADYLKVTDGVLVGTDALDPVAFTNIIFLA